MGGWRAAHAKHHHGHEINAGTAARICTARIRGRPPPEITEERRSFHSSTTPSAHRFLCLRSTTRATGTRSPTPMAMCMVAPMSAAPNMRAAGSIGRAWEIQAGRSVYERHNNVCWISMPGRTLRSSMPARSAHATFPALGMSRVSLRLSSHAGRKARGPRDIRLHFTAKQRLDASPDREELA